MSTGLIFSLSCAGLAIIYGAISCRWILAQPAGSGKMQENNNKTVIIQGDPQTEHRYIIYAMDVAQGEGAEQMAFAVEEEQQEE